MDLAITAAAGFLFKTLDEIEDIHFIKSPSLKEYIRNLSIAVFSVLFLNNTYMAWLVALCVIPISFYLKQVDTPFWKSLVPLPYLALATLLHTHGFSFSGLSGIPSILSLLSTAMSFGVYAFICVLEAMIFPEEISLVKFGSRISLILIFASMIYFLDTNPSTTHLLCLCIGYCLASTMIKFYVHSSDLIPSKEYEKFSEMTIEEIMAEEIPLIKQGINEGIIANKEVFRRVLMLLVISFLKIDI
jgi:hypothetical protein